MDFGSPEFVIAIVALSMGAWIINTWLRVKHGYPLDDGAGNVIERSDTGENKRLREQNQQLRDVMERMEDRMVVLERIVTDKGYTVAEEIEALRDRPARNTRDTGVPLEIGRKENV